MRTLTIEEADQLQYAQTKLVDTLKDLAIINRMMTQLTTDECTFQLQFLLHNVSVCNQNKSMDKASVFAEKDNCSLSLNHRGKESPGIRILHAIKQEKQVLIEELQKEINSLLPNFLSPNIVSNEHLQSSSAR